MRWADETLLAIARRIARQFGRTSDEAYPIKRIRDGELIHVYVRDVGFVPA